MASSNNLVTMEPWLFRPTFNDSWISEMFLRETETLTKALQKSISNNSSDAASADIMVSASLLNHEIPPPIQTPTASGPTVSGGSENETAASKRRSVGASGKITKRKSRASKRTATTYITADAANFRQMVQQITGVRFDGNNRQLPVNPVLKPEPQRPVNRMLHQQSSGCLPTLDTSAFLLDHNNHHQQRQPQLTVPPSSVVMQPAGLTPPPPHAVVADCGSAGFDFESFCSFPTLESWKVM